MKTHLFIIAILFFGGKLFSQVDTIFYNGQDTLLPTIKMIGAYHEGKNYLRWAPNNASLWFSTSASGFKLDRYMLNDALVPDQNSLKSVLVQAWPLENFRPYLNPANDHVLAAAQCLYGEWESNKDANQNIFARADEAENRYGIAMLIADLDSLAARALGLSYVDVDVVPGKRYLYILKPANDSLSANYSYALSIETGNIYLPTPQIDTLEEKERSIAIYWDKFAYEDAYSAYWLERKGPNERNYTRITKEPIVPVSSSDFEGLVVSHRDSVTNYVPYSYRLVGISPFGFLSLPSPSVTGMGRDKTPPDAVTDFAVVEEKGRLKLSWVVPRDADLDHIDVYRSVKIEGPFEKINPIKLPKTQTSFIDTSNIVVKSPYYMVASVDTAANPNFSIKLRGFLRDTIAPAPPVGLKGTIDSQGVVRLTWDVNLEPDLEGYYVYYANQIDHQFINLTGYPIRNNTYIDTITLKTLTEHVYYKITAADQFNHISKFSEAIEIKRPDTIPPSPAQIVDYQLEENAVVFNIARSKSKDVAVQEILRRNIPEGQWQKLGDLKADTYTDRSVAIGQTYEYMLHTMDDEGNMAYDKAPVVITVLDKSKAQEAEITTINADSLSRSITITWELHPQSIQVIIYRSINGKPFVTLARSKNVGQFEDKDNIVPGRSYAYKIKQVMNDGKISTLSEALSINLKPKE